MEPEPDVPGLDLYLYRWNMHHQQCLAAPNAAGGISPNPLCSAAGGEEAGGAVQGELHKIPFEREALYLMITGVRCYNTRRLESDKIVKF